MGPCGCQWRTVREGHVNYQILTLTVMITMQLLKTLQIRSYRILVSLLVQGRECVILR